jgi:tyrosine phenol-lyase
MERWKTIIEPFRIHSVEPIRITTRDERLLAVEEAGYNLFNLHADDVLIDLLTDSGTGAMSRDQWAAVQHGDESYAGSPSWYVFLEAVHDLFPFRHVIPTHQGRAAEKILFSVVGGPGRTIPNNTHFDTTRANVEFTGAAAVDLVIEEGRHPEMEHPFKGNMDVDALDRLIAERGAANVPLVMVTVTNNSGGGQPVSMANVRELRAWCEPRGIRVLLDATRMVENALFIQEREEGYADRSIAEILLEFCSFTDGAWMSAKKDNLVNIGGWLAVNDWDTFEELRNLVVVYEGLHTYGGMAGRDMEALAIGIEESVQDQHVRSRVGQVRYLGELLEQWDIPIVRPVGGHAIFLDARRFYPHLPQDLFPAQTLAGELYLDSGIRSMERGIVSAGRDPETGDHKRPKLELTRLTIPRRVYTQAHMDVVAESVKACFDARGAAKGLRMVYEPKYLRFFQARFEPL